MASPEDLTTVWAPPAHAPAVGDVLLGAAAAVHGELPALKLRPPRGGRAWAGQPAPGIAQLTDTEQLALINPSAEGARARLGVPEADRAVVLLVDGLGWHNLHARAEAAPFLTGSFEASLGHSAAPSTTATNITYLGTGALPGQTRMSGYTVRNPETGGPFNLISWAGGMDPVDWQRVPTVFERLAAAGTPGTHVSTWRFEGSGLTQAALRGASYLAAESLPERVDAAAGQEGTVTYVYWAEVDATGHQHGWRGADWAEELARVDAQVERLARTLAPGTLLMVTADHGMVDVPRRTSQVFGGPARIDIAAEPQLAEGVDLVAGENRFVYLFTADPDAVARRWRDFFGERARVWRRGEAFEAGVFGPVREDAADVVGDVMVAVLGDLSVGDRRTMSEAMINLPGLHGSLTAWERAVPVLALMT